MRLSGLRGIRAEDVLDNMMASVLVVLYLLLMVLAFLVGFTWLQYSSTDSVTVWVCGVDFVMLVLVLAVNVSFYSGARELLIALIAQLLLVLSVEELVAVLPGGFSVVTPIGVITPGTINDGLLMETGVMVAYASLVVVKWMWWKKLIVTGGDCKCPGVSGI